MSFEFYNYTKDLIYKKFFKITTKILVHLVASGVERF